MRKAINRGLAALGEQDNTKTRFRVLGLILLGVYFFHLRYSWNEGNPWCALWMCNVSNLALAIGLLAAQPTLIRVAVIWLIPGIPLWVMDMALTGEVAVISFVTHLACPVIGLYALHRVRAARWTWLHAVLLYLFCQQIARMFSPPEFNVNVAHSIYPGWERFFSAYWQYWIFTTVSAMAGLWVLGRVLLWLFPPIQSEPAETPAQADADLEPPSPNKP